MPSAPIACPARGERSRHGRGTPHPGNPAEAVLDPGVRDSGGVRLRWRSAELVGAQPSPSTFAPLVHSTERIQSSPSPRPARPEI